MNYLRLKFLLFITFINHAYAINLQSISSIQGTKNISPFVNKKVTVEGVVIGDFQNSNQLKGFFIQSLNPDNNKNSSEGLFIKDSRHRVDVGDLVRVSGEISEDFKVTHVNNISNLQRLKTKVKLPKPFAIKLPLNDFDLETIEGMRVTLEQASVISDHYNYIKFGELTVSSKLLMNPSSIVLPGEQTALQKISNANNRLIIDDGSNTVFPQPFKADARHPMVLGVKLQTIGVMHYSYNQYKLEPTQAISFIKPQKIRQNKPNGINGKIKVASFNLKNFFTTLDKGKQECGPSANFICRGADTEQEYQRQLQKLISAINTADADIIGLQELENNKNQSIKALVKALNKASFKNKWSYIDTGILGQDVIKVGLLYQAKKVIPVGDYALLNAKVDPDFEENRNRVVVAQSFKADTSQNIFTLAVVHLKSKNCKDAEGANKNQKDGQSCYNASRSKVAYQIVKWLKTNPTKNNSMAQIIAGDFNSYQKEDPMRIFAKAGFKNLADSYLPADNWSTSFRGSLGAIDHILVNPAAQKFSTGFTQWHINSTETELFDYNMEMLSKTLKKPDDFYLNNPFSSSDHDLVMAGFDF